MALSAQERYDESLQKLVAISAAKRAYLQQQRDKADRMKRDFDQERLAAQQASEQNLASGIISGAAQGYGMSGSPWGALAGAVYGGATGAYRSYQSQRAAGESGGSALRGVANSFLNPMRQLEEISEIPKAELFQSATTAGSRYLDDQRLAEAKAEREEMLNVLRGRSQAGGQFMPEYNPIGEAAALKSGTRNPRLVYPTEPIMQPQKPFTIYGDR